MTSYSKIAFYLKSLFRKRKLNEQLSEEIQTHVDMATEENVAKGMKPEEARYAALREFGNVASVQERTRDERGWVWLEQVWQDLRYAVRSLAKTPGFTLTVIVTLGLGLGVNSALFSVFNAVALRSLPLKNPEELVTLVGRNDIGWRQYGFSFPDYLDLQAGQRGGRAMAAWREDIVTMDAREANAPAFAIRGVPSETLAYLPLQLVSHNFFDLVGAELALGRGFRAEEGLRPGAGPVIVLQHQFWMQQFHSDPNVLGQTIKLRDTVFTVIGVAAAEFVGTMPAPPIGWVPAMMLDDLAGNGAHPLSARHLMGFRLVARLPLGSAREQARAELEVLTRQLALKYPDKNSKTRIEFEDCGRLFAASLNWKALAVSSPILLCFVSVLLIACANVANLLLARATTRQQEIGVRLALGAGRGRILRHLLMESILVALAGGLAGLLVATWTLHVIRPEIIALAPTTAGDVRQWLFVNLTPDHRIFGFTFLLSLGAALAAGLFPALLAARADVNVALKNDGSAFSRRSGLRHALVVVQVAVCLTLLTASGILVRVVLRNATINPGMRAANTYSADFALRSAEAGPDSAAASRGGLGEDAARSPTARREALARARSLPGVKTVARVHRVPFSGRMRLTPVEVDGHDATNAPLVAKFNFVSAEYFAMFGLVATKGRVFTAAEAQQKLPVVVVSEATARRYWLGEDPLGKRLKISSIAAEGGWLGSEQARQTSSGAFTSYEVIGVMPDVRSGWVWESDETMLYLPLPEDGSVARTSTLVQFTGPLEKALPLASGSASVQGVQLGVNAALSIDALLHLQLLPFKGVAAVGMALGGLALVMSMVGLHGVMTFAVNQRVREIGIRTALGATADAIVGLFLRQGMRLVVVGLVLGGTGGIGAGVLLSKYVILGAQPFEPLACGAVALLFALVAGLACWLPARRATKVDPMVALRTE